MIRSSIAIRTGFWIGTAILLLPAGCKNADTVVAPLIPTATPPRVAATATPTPTAPSSSPTPTATRTRTPPPPTSTPVPTAVPTADLSGDWTGSVHWRDSDWWWPCGDPRLVADANVASAHLGQSGATVAGTIHTACGDVRFEGTIDRAQLTGTSTFQPHGENGASTGSGNPRFVQLSTPVMHSLSGCSGPCEIGGFSLQLAR
jgi:hypothetical protein